MCAFPNIVISKNIWIKSKKNSIDMVLTIFNNVGVLFTWSVHISKYSNE